MSISIHKLRIKAKVDRGQACLAYMRTRRSPMTLKDLASKLGMTPKSISNSLAPLLEQGVVKRDLILRRSSLCNKSGWAYGYVATDAKKANPLLVGKKSIKAIERELKKDERAREAAQKKRQETKDAATIAFHDPFGLGQRL